MLAAVFAGEGRLVMEDRPTPVIAAPDDVLVEVEACGICGSDLQMLNVPPGHPATPGTILGHEMVGRIAAVGEAVTSVAVGTRVIIDPDPKCGSCDPCRAGRPASCLNVVALGVYRDGALASHVLAPAATAHPISDAVPTAIAALAEPLSCVVNGTRKAAARPGQSVLIFGAGAIGCLFLAVFRASGCAPIIVVEPTPARADVARAMGADEVVTPDQLQQVLDARMPGGADVVVDAVGNQLGTAIASAGMVGADRRVRHELDRSAADPPGRDHREVPVDLRHVHQRLHVPRGDPPARERPPGRRPDDQRGHAAGRRAELRFAMLRSGGATKVIITP